LIAFIIAIHNVINVDRAFTTGGSFLRRGFAGGFVILKGNAAKTPATLKATMASTWRF
jgi:hypothetical protein